MLPFFPSPLLGKMSPEPVNASHDMAEKALADIIQVMYLQIGKLS